MKRFLLIFILSTICGRSFAPIITAIGLSGPGHSPILSRDATLGAVILIGSREVGVWDVLNARQLLTLKVANETPESIAFTPNGKGIAVGFRSGEIRSYEVATGNLISRFTGHTDAVTSLAIEDNRRGGTVVMVSGSDDATVRVWEYSAARNPLLNTFQVAGSPRVALQDGAQLAAALCPSGIVRVYNLTTGKEVVRGTSGAFYTPPTGIQASGAIGFTSQNEILVSMIYGVTADRVAFPIDIVTGRVGSQRRLVNIPHLPNNLFINAASVSRMQFSSDGTRLLAANIPLPLAMTSHMPVVMPFCAHLYSVSSGQSTIGSSYPTTDSHVALSADGKTALIVKDFFSSRGSAPVNRMEVWELP